MSRARWPLILVVLMTLGAGCEPYDVPLRALPADLQVVSLDGTARKATDALRGKPWVLQLWVPGCSGCTREVPAFERVRARYEPQGVGFLLASLAPERDVVERTARQLGMQGEVVVLEGEALAPLGVSVVPSLVFVDENGTIVASASGERSEAFLERRTRALLPREPSRTPGAHPLAFSARSPRAPAR